jgi:DNA (cytosine-5)-methyltransferase 1
MEGDRSSLILEAIRLISECRPRVFIWENVKGTFSSNSGEDFSAIIQAFANIGGYRLEWQLLNTSWFLPQNRERIYLVGYSTEPKRDWRGVFPIGESNNLSNAMARERQTSACITTSYHKGVNYDNQLIKVKSATSLGYEEATSGDTINFSQPNSETRRGRVGKQKAQTLETSCNQAVVQPNYSSKSLNETIERNILTEGEPKALDLYNRQARDESPTLTEPHHNSLRLFDGYRIRRLTPIECERLQGFPDQHTAFGNYNGEVNPMSNTQRYRQCGNAVTVDVVEAIANKIKPLFK